MKNFSELITKDIRLVILRMLEEDNDFSHNDSVIRAGLELLGHKVSQDRVRTEVSWLKEQGLVTTEDVGPVMIVQLTVRGQDVATGAATVPGVKRPSPRN